MVGIVGVQFGCGQLFNLWSFQNDAYVTFNQEINFADGVSMGVPFDDRLIGYWDMNDGSGIVVRDVSGNNNNGTFYGYNNGLISGAVHVAGQFENALSFNNSGDFVSLSSAISLTGEYTLSVWVNRFSALDYDFIFGSSEYDTKIGLTASGYLLVRAQLGGDTDYTVPVPTGKWVNIIVTRSSNDTIYAYVDGAKYPLFGGVAQPDPFYMDYIGVDDSENYFNGIIDTVCVYNCALSQSEIVLLSDGVRVGGGLINEWLFDESGDIIYDTHMWVDGKYGTAVNFANDYVQVDDSNEFALSPTWSVSAWMYPTKNGTMQTLLSKCDSETGWVFGTDVTGEFHVYTPEWESSSSRLPIDLNYWQLWTFTFDGSMLRYFKNDVAAGVASLVNDALPVTSNELQIGACSAFSSYFNGLIDDLRIYNRAISSAEVAALYCMGPYAQPDPVSYGAYYNFTDSVTNSTMLLHIDGSKSNSNNVALVTCTNFFENGQLAFQTNQSVIANIWTNLGRPAFTTGIWNQQNYTTTLLLDASFTAELNWNKYDIVVYTDQNSTVFPSNTTVSYGESKFFNFTAPQEYHLDVIIDGISQGRISNYTFSNVTAPHVVNVTSTQVFTINSSAVANGSVTPSGSVIVDYGRDQRFDFVADMGYHVSKVLVDNATQSLDEFYVFQNVTANHNLSVSFALNTYNITAIVDEHSIISPSNLSVVHGGNQQFNITADNGYVSHVYVDGEDCGNLTSYAFADVTETHTIVVVSEPAASPVVVPPDDNKTPTPSASPSEPPTQPPSDSLSSDELIVLVIGVIAAGFALFGLALKKGYITLEVADENPDADGFSTLGSVDSDAFDRRQITNLSALPLAVGGVAEGALGNQFSVYVEGVYVKEGKILLLKRNVVPFQGYWDVVGGLVAENESLKDVLQQQFKDALNLTVTVDKIVGGRIVESDGKTVIVVTFEVTSVHGEIKLGTKYSEYNWFSHAPINSTHDYTKYLRKKA
ncbi:MAG: hypothetical protein NWF04_00395 [Candidatus Bathyarchaeota archaeon]|nr:hypothetical protein [Candidatus Bathyarchaeota archaeon]